MYTLFYLELVLHRHSHGNQARKIVLPRTSHLSFPPPLNHRHVGSPARKENQPKELPQTFQGQEKNWQRSLRYSVFGLEAERPPNGGCESIFEREAVLGRQGEGVALKLDKADEESVPSEHNETGRSLRDG